MSESDHEQLAGRLDEEAERLKQRSQELGDEVDAVREDWERKRADDAVPGAPPPPEADAEAPKPDETPPW